MIVNYVKLNCDILEQTNTLITIEVNWEWKFILSISTLFFISYIN